MLGCMLCTQQLTRQKYNYYNYMDSLIRTTIYL